MDLFKEEFKYYKVKSPLCDFSRVQDFHKAKEFPGIIEYGINRKRNLLQDNEYVETSSSDKECLICLSCGLNFHAEWRVFGHSDVPGLIFVTNPFTPFGQNIWIRNCLLDYPFKPNVTNIGTLVKNAAKKDFDYLKKLRWTTLGYHHNWDTKVYTKNRHSPFPSSLAVLSKHLSTVLGNTEFHPEAAIVNYYHMNSTLSGHVDCSEKDLTSPLFSISFGQKAIFLIGGKTKSVRPTAMFLKSGDIVVMSKESRLCYHGVPKILEDENEWKWDSRTDSDAEWHHLLCYMRQSRINMNIRQVLAPGQILEE